MREEVLEKIIERASKIWNKDVSEFSKDTLFTDLEAKSAHYSQITTFLEDAFDIEVPYMNFKRCKSFDEAAGYVVELLEE